MKKYKLIVLFLILVLNFDYNLHAQQTTISSEESYISFSTISDTESTIDTTGISNFTIIYPKFNSDLVFISEYEVINFIGKLQDIENIQSVLLNDKEIEWSKDGLFGEMLNLELGNNKLILRIIYSDGSFNETDLMINYISRNDIDKKGTAEKLLP